jgi:ribosomal protein S18 acetylase RimI-like enzyme
MEFTKLNINSHDLQKVAELIFETETDVFSLLFGKNTAKAFHRIKNVVKIGKNSFGYEHIYLAVKGRQILGLTVFYKGDEIDLKIESDKFSEALDFVGRLRLIFYEKVLLDRLLITKLEENDMYISNVCVDKKNRGMGIGNFLLNNIVRYAKSNQCKRIILDVSKDNNAAISLYKKNGFKTNIEKSSKIWGITVINMIKEL